MKSLHNIAFIILVVGAVNYGLRGLSTVISSIIQRPQYWDVINLTLGQWRMLEALVYVLIGAAAVYEIATHKKNCKDCGSGQAAA